jgi:hypothetical protein
MNIDISEITTNAVIAVPIVIAIVQAIKLTGFVQDHFAPLVSIAVGMLIGWIGHNDSPDLSNTLLTGAIYGLIASGLYSGVKTTMLARNRQKSQEAKEKYQKENPK